MRVKTRAMAAAAITSFALLATACGGGGGETPDPGSSEPAGTTGGEISMRGCTPQNSLIPANTGEQCGSDILDGIDRDADEVQHRYRGARAGLAESIETEDNQNFTVKLKAGQKFHDGTDVKAKNFVDAWNWSAAGPNAMYNSYFFTPIEGYDDVQCGADADGAADCEGKPPKTDKMSGLKVVDDTTFTIKTSEKVSNLPVRLGYTVFAPLPDSFFSRSRGVRGEADRRRARSSSRASPTPSIVKTKFAEYTGDDKPSIDKVTLRVYQDDEAAYNDVLANSLDYTDIIPSDRLVGDLYKTELDNRYVERETGTIAVNSFSPIDKAFEERGPAPGHLDGHRPGTDQQADLQRHPPTGHGLGLSGGRRLQARRLR